MDKIEKLLRKISRKDRERLLLTVERLLSKKFQGLNISKLKDSDLCRVRSGRFRIIYHQEKKSKRIIIDSIKLRDEDTYKF